MMDMEQKKNKYMKAVRRKITAPAARKKEYLHLLGNQIDDYIEAYNPATFEAVSDHFGTAAEIAETFMSEFSADEIRKSISCRRWRGVIVIVLVLISYYVLTDLFDQLVNGNEAAYYVDTIEEGEEIILEE